MILGVTGSGKSVLAARVARLIGSPDHTMDDLYWTPGWLKVPVEQRLEAYAAIAASPRWVVDGLPSAARAVLLPRADLVVALDYPRWLSLGRLLRRTARRLVTGEEVCNGNVERLRDTLGRESIIAWHFRSYASVRAEITALGADADAPPVRRMATQRATDAWLERLARGLDDDADPGDD